ncbi:Abi family protein [Staphylococcus sp. IVB6240]|uniref:Abi family protein n=1 Tax=Staphylococcus sp. IVB6240 TaxID=2989771 RepID=UPI0021D3EA84|nr:Abi family protein [Staphylococcus sp. IVB6240]UXR72321.1 Abi family protein [Staphylococcus sp. IVB6240]
MAKELISQRDSPPVCLKAYNGGFSFGVDILIESKTYCELKSILQNEKNINIISDEHCISLLKTYGYFNLINNYKTDLTETLKHEIVSIDDLVHLKEFDNDLQSLVFKNLIKIETTLKSHLSYLMATKFGVTENEYKNHFSYKNHISAKKVFKNIENKKHINFNKLPAKHYKDKYNDIPPWVYLKHIPLGDTLNIFKELNTDDKAEIINEWPEFQQFAVKDKIEIFIELIYFCKDFRDSIAHGGRLLNYISDKKIKFTLLEKMLKPSIMNKKEFSTYSGGFFLLTLIITILLPSLKEKNRFSQEFRSFYNLYLQETENHFLEMFHMVANLPENYVIRLQNTIW